VEADPEIDDAIDRALAVSEWDVTEVALPRWYEATAAAGILLVAEAWETDRALVARRPDEIGADVVGRLTLGASIDDRGLASARAVQEAWDLSLAEVFRRVDVIATPTLTVFPPSLDGGEELLMARCTLPVNLAGVPALALPVPTTTALPASIQLIGPRHSEEKLLAAGLAFEAALSTVS
jgi:amidase